jgi:hypothetical protein
MFVTKTFKVYELSVQPPKIAGVLDLFTKRNSETFYFMSLDEAKKFSDARYPDRKCDTKTRDAFHYEGKLQVLADKSKPKISRPIKLRPIKLYDRKLIGDDIVTAAREGGSGTFIAAKLQGRYYVGADHARIMSDAECFIRVGDSYVNNYAPGKSEVCYHYYTHELKHSPIQLEEGAAKKLSQALGI